MDKADVSDDSIKALIQSKISEMRVAVCSKLKTGVATSSARGLSSLPSFVNLSARKRLAPPSSPSSFKERQESKFTSHC